MSTELRNKQDLRPRKQDDPTQEHKVQPKHNEDKPRTGKVTKEYRKH